MISKVLLKGMKSFSPLAAHLTGAFVSILVAKVTSQRKTRNNCGVNGQTSDAAVIAKHH